MDKKKEHVIDVRPLDTKEKIEDFKWALKKFASERDYILFLIGTNTGLRVSDILKIKTEDIIKLKNKKEKELKIQEKKTTKSRFVRLNNIFPEVIAYAEGVKSEWLFPSRKGNAAVSVIQVWRQFQKASEWAEIEGIGTHTMRKTFGYWMYKQTGDIVKVMRLLNHSKPEVTLQYIGITEEEIRETIEDFVL